MTGWPCYGCKVAGASCLRMPPDAETYLIKENTLWSSCDLEPFGDVFFIRQVMTINIFSRACLYVIPNINKLDF